MAGRYRLVREIARGGSGSIWRAEQVLLRMPVAVKFLRAGGEGRDDTPAARSAAMKRFLSEARIAAAVRGAHVVQVFDYGVERGTPFLVMELLSGESLAARLQRLGRLGPEETVHTLLQAAAALQRMHDLGVVHRDLKPENLFLSEGDERSVKLLDFGVAMVDDRALLTTLTPGTGTGELAGSPSYMSPEQLRDPGALDPRSDVWAFGVIAFECLLGRLPFRADHLAGMIVAICARPAPIPSLLGPVPRGFDGWFARACARDLERRFATVREAAAELRHLCQPPRAAPMEAPARGEELTGDLPVAWEPSSSGLKRLWSGLFRRPSPVPRQLPCRSGVRRSAR